MVLLKFKRYYKKSFRGRLHCRYRLINHRMYEFFGEEIYRLCYHNFYNFYKFHDNKHLWVNLNKSGMEVRYFNLNIGECMFRNLAFPESSDNTEEYFNEFYPGQEDLKRTVLKIKLF